MEEGKTCKNCRFWGFEDDEFSGIPNTKNCNHVLLLMCKELYDEETFKKGRYAGALWLDKANNEIWVDKDFGCIHWGRI